MANIIKNSSLNKLISKSGQSSRIEPGVYQFASPEDERAAQRLESFLFSLLHQKASIAAFENPYDDDDVTPSLDCKPLITRSASAGTPSSSGKNSGAQKTRAEQGKRDTNATTAKTTTTTAPLQDATNASRALPISDACKRFINNIKERVGPPSSQICLPDDLTAKLAVNIVRMVEGEERGVRGCAIIVMLHDGDRKTALGKVVCDPSCVTRTLLRLHLNRMDNPQASGAEAGDSKQSSKKNIIYISPAYTLEKTKKSRLRRSATGNYSSDASLSTSKSSPGLCRMGSRTYDVY